MKTVMREKLIAAPQRIARRATTDRVPFVSQRVPTRNNRPCQETRASGSAFAMMSIPSGMRDFWTREYPRRM